MKPYHTTDLGTLYQADCLDFLWSLQESSIDTLFADPPFNIGKDYGGASNDNLKESEYLSWCRTWLRECIRILKPGGALFLYNLPKWNIPLGAYLSKRGMTFRHWIAIEMTNSLPIQGRLYPAHYSLLYYTKGEPKTFRKVRTPLQTCRHCGKDIKDYGGHKGKLHSDGISLKDVWTDISPVRHSKYKQMERGANTLSTKILDRVVTISTEPGDLVVDPFLGSGTTAIVCEYYGRRWTGSEIEQTYADLIVERLSSPEICAHQNDDVVEDRKRVTLKI